jgi:light-regulated signal transduction histidine kinase (bacteriophytochrome)
MSGSIQDVTEHKQVEGTLARRVAELHRSNEELEQFAYVASHDLKEPLRMVASYTRLLAEEYEDLLDEEGKKYIRYATDGAKRMQALIDDLLTYSRVGRAEVPQQHVDLNDVMRDVRVNLVSSFKDTGGVLEVGKLPAVEGNPTLFAQLMQNLVANAIKFHGEAPPQICVSCQKRDDELVITVQDNGIGIAPEHQQRVFQVFQRLHSRSEYEGTGIGLAVCKKIVEQYGGRIWIESELGRGSTFYFTLSPEHSHSTEEEQELALT